MGCGPLSGARRPKRKATLSVGGAFLGKRQFASGALLRAFSELGERRFGVERGLRAFGHFSSPLCEEIGSDKADGLQTPAQFAASTLGKLVGELADLHQNTLFNKALYARSNHFGRSNVL